VDRLQRCGGISAHGSGPHARGGDALQQTNHPCSPLTRVGHSIPRRGYLGPVSFVVREPLITDGWQRARPGDAQKQPDDSDRDDSDARSGCGPPHAHAHATMTIGGPCEEEQRLWSIGDVSSSNHLVTAIE